MSEATRERILVTGPDLAPEAVALLQDFEFVYGGKQADEEYLLGLCKEAQPTALIVRYGKVTARMMNACERLRVIAKHGVGLDTIDLEAAAARGIPVKPALGANAIAVAEHTWGLIFACAKSIPGLNGRMHAGEWDKATHKSVELAGHTLGVVGLGAIGRKVAAMGVALGMRVIGYDPYVTELPPGVTASPLHSLFQSSDVVSLHCPLTTENRNMINRNTLGLFRQGAILINTARGGLIEESALVHALLEGRLRSAGLDSFANEPLPAEHIFRGVPNLIMTPHVGSLTSDTYKSMGVACAHNILGVLRGA
jgi:D-3-phosphoglycerate dehydrogenase / 2-oxoglutarate reductase